MATLSIKNPYAYEFFCQVRNMMESLHKYETTGLHCHLNDYSEWRKLVEATINKVNERENPQPVQQTLNI